MGLAQWSINSRFVHRRTFIQATDFIIPWILDLFFPTKVRSRLRAKRDSDFVLFDPSFSSTISIIASMRIHATVATQCECDSRGNSCTTNYYVRVLIARVHWRYAILPLIPRHSPHILHFSTSLPLPPPFLPDDYVRCSYYYPPRNNGCATSFISRLHIGTIMKSLVCSLKRCFRLYRIACACAQACTHAWIRNNCFYHQEVNHFKEF